MTLTLCLILISSLPLVFGAIRLAKFNAYSIQSDGSHYLGLPTPANAISEGEYPVSNAC